MGSQGFLSRQDRKVLFFAALGGALEFYDFIIFVYLATQIGTLFFPASTTPWLRDVQTWGLFAAGYFARPLGGIIMAHFGDKTGRKRVFIFSVFLMAVPTLLIGLLPTFAQIGYLAPLALLALRILQGAAIGGEVPGAWTFVAEHVPDHRTAFACATLTAGLSAGILIGSTLTAILHSQLTPAEMLSFGWRLPFLIGGIFGFLAVLLRRMLAETPVFEALRQRRALIRDLPLKETLRHHAPAVFTSLILTWLLTAVVIVLILMTPNLLQKLHAIAPERTFFADTLATLGLALGNLAYGLAADRFGLRRVLICGCLLLLLMVYVFFLGISATADSLYPLSLLMGLCAGVVGLIPTMMVRAYPAPVRFSGVSFSYNLAYALFGGLTPLFVSRLFAHYPLAPAHYVAALCVVGILVVLATSRRKTYSLLPTP